MPCLQCFHPVSQNKIQKKKSTMISSGHFSECETAVVCWNYRNTNSLMLTLRMALESPISAQMLRVGWAKKRQKQRKCWRSGDKETKYSWKMKSKGGPMNSGEGRSKTNGPNARVLKRFASLSFTACRVSDDSAIISKSSCMTEAFL